MLHSACLREERQKDKRNKTKKKKTKEQHHTKKTLNQNKDC